MAGVERKKRGDKPAPPQGPGHALQHPEQHDRIEHMEQQVYGVPTRRFRAEELRVEHMRQPGERMPVAEVGALQGPEDPGPAQPAEHARILLYVATVIQEEEAVMQHTVVDPASHDGKRQSQNVLACLWTHACGSLRPAPMPVICYRWLPFAPIILACGVLKNGAGGGSRSGGRSGSV